MTNKDTTTQKREELLEKLDNIVPTDDSPSMIMDSDAICLDALNDQELAFLLEQHEENMKNI